MNIFSRYLKSARLNLFTFYLSKDSWFIFPQTAGALTNCEPTLKVIQGPVHKDLKNEVLQSLTSIYL